MGRIETMVNEVEAFQSLTIVSATPGHWSVYKISDGEYIKRPVIAWGIAVNSVIVMATAVHPGCTVHTDEPVAIIDPSGVVTTVDGERRWGSWIAFKAWIQAGGRL
jgi:hypothetical protein